MNLILIKRVKYHFAEKYCCINIEESYVFDVYVVIILHYAKYYGWDAYMSLISV